MKKEVFMKKLFLFFFVLYVNPIFASPLSLKPIIILMEFKDYKHTDLEKKEKSVVNGWGGSVFTPELYSHMFYEKNDYLDSDGSKHMTASHYFDLESGNTFNLIGSEEDIYGWYTAKKKIKKYGKNHSKYGDRLNASKLVVEGVENLIDKNIDFSKYDLDNDGIIDSIIIIHAGKGEQWNNSLGSKAIWPFFNKFEDINKGKYYSFKDSKGKIWKINKFAIIEEDLTLDLFIHEVGHFLGLNDLYQHNSPIMYWSIMANLYSGYIPGKFPNSMGAYPRFILQHEFEKKGYPSKWANIKEFDLDYIKQNPQELFIFPSIEKNKINLIKINLDKNSDHKKYYLLEWRDPDEHGIDAGLNHTLEKISYQGGLLIWYIDESNTDENGKPIQKFLNGSRFASIVDADPSPIFITKEDGVYPYRSNKYNMYDAAFSLRSTHPIIEKGYNFTLYHENLPYTPYFSSQQILYPQYSKRKNTAILGEDLKIILHEDYKSFGKVILFSGKIGEDDHHFSLYTTDKYFLIKSPSLYDIQVVMAKLDSNNNVINRKIIPLAKIEPGIFKGMIPNPKEKWKIEYIREARSGEYTAVYNSEFTDGWGIKIENTNDK
jgi:M6 family metalloprotease-like protein